MCVRESGWVSGCVTESVCVFERERLRECVKDRERESEWERENE